MSSTKESEQRTSQLYKIPAIANRLELFKKPNYAHPLSKEEAGVYTMFHDFASSVIRSMPAYADVGGVIHTLNDLLVARNEALKAIQLGEMNK